MKNKFYRYILGAVFLSLVLFNFSFAQADYTAGTLVSMTNSARAREGSGALTVSAELTTAASNKVQDMLANQYFAHTSPQGKTPWDFIKEAGYNYSYAGENLAIGYTDSNELFNAWMASLTHRENILNSNFRQVGIAVASGTFQGTQTLIVAQEFGTPQETGEVASEEVATPNPESTSTPGTVTTPNPAQTFEFIKEKSTFSPKSIFAGEEVMFSVTVSGDVQLLEAKVFDKTINLLETSQVAQSGKEKTYLVKQKIENEGSSEVKITAKDKYGHSEDLILGKLDVNKTVISKTETQPSRFSPFREAVKNYWLVIVIFGAIVFTGIGYLILRKVKLGKIKIGLSTWEL